MDASASKVAHIVMWCAYPFIISIALGLHHLLFILGTNLQLSTYIPVIFGVLAITYLEFRYPYEKLWLPNATDVKNDLLFMIFIQGVLPKLLAFSFVMFLLKNPGAEGAYWPHHASPYTQAFLMMLLADLLRYWLHRFAHEWYPLWRLHAVHHSPDKLYWFNVGRFHPFDKGLQFLLDALPFIVLGVSEEVLSIYFVFYAINGFFQHCNIKLHLGFLNYLISGPELHRWHHSLVVKEANSNYGNNLIVWDLIFGTWFLPKDECVAELGLKNRDYPMGFIAQMRAPFIEKIDQVPL